MTDDDKLGLLRRLKQDFEYYAPRCLRVKPKIGGQPIPFLLNRPQRYIHNRLERQRLETGKVRALILKARQQGASTYIEGRLFHKVSLNRGLKSFILTHEQKATDNLFGMASTYYDYLPADVKPHLGAANANELVFDRLLSGYAVATAGSKDTGRSSTAQLFHGSEVAFWKNAETHMMGIGQIVPNAPGSEIVLESTANGIGNVFHNMWQIAEAGQSEYIPIFTPWHWSEEYSTPVPKGWTFAPEDLEYQRLYRISDDQLYWRRLKIETDFGGSDLRFQQEYPATAAEAFVNVGHLPFIPVEDVLKARKERDVQAIGARLLGVDPARDGPDRSALVWRKGRVVNRIEAHNGINTMQLAGIVANEIATGQIDKVFIDTIGIGAGVYDRLIELGYGAIVSAVVASAQASDPKRHSNKKAEMWDNMRVWFENGPVQIPDSDELQSDIVAPQANYQSNGQILRIESKDDLAKRGLRSPDYGDALANTFAYPVSETFDRSELATGQTGYAPRRVQRRSRDWRTR